MTATTYSLGIDLGTTFTAAAVHRDGDAAICLLGSRGAPVPSLVFLRDDQAVLTGEAAERRGMVEPIRLAREFKRRVGDSAPILLGQAPYSAERLMAALLEQVAAVVAAREGGPPGHVAVSHPANWGPFKIDLLRHALDLAGLRSVTLLTEPVAAAVHYASKKRLEPGAVVAVYDLGGGTFDAAVLRRTETGFETLGQPEGIERLGGIDFDEAVLAYVRNELNGKLEELDGNDPSIRVAMGRLRRECVAAKEALSFDSETTIPVTLPNVHTDIRITRADFEPMIRAAIAETIEALRRAIERAGVRPDDLDSVLLVGGSSQIPLVAELVSQALGRPVAVDAHPKNAVALGAAVVAAGAAGGGNGTVAAPAATPVAVGASPAPAAVPAAVPAGPVPAVPLTPGPAAPPAAAAASPVGPGPAAPGPGPALPPPGTPGTLPGTPGTPGTPGRHGQGEHPGVVTVDAAPPAGGGADRPVRLARRFAVAAAAVALLGAATAGAYALGADAGDAREGDPERRAAAAPSTTAESSTTVTEPPPPPCPSASGRCARITGISLDGDRYVAGYETEDFDPLIFKEGTQGTPDDHHVHFFLDTTAPENAGTNGSDPGEWTLWDRPSGGGELRFDALTVADRGQARQLCVIVADATHAVEADSGNCIALPGA